jgi:small subunit ribosomal protein S2
VSQDVSLKDLLEAGCHFGHQSKRWNPKMKPYLFAKRDGIHIFDLAQTKEGLLRACEFVKDWVAQGKQIVFVGTKRQAQAMIKEEAQRCGMPYVWSRWLGGTITNWEMIKKSLDKLRELKQKKEAGDFKEYTKKENLLIDREIERLEKFFGGLSTLKGRPEAIFVIDSKAEDAAIKEAVKKEVKVVATVDSNADPTVVDYVIPVNDDAVKAIRLVVQKIAEAVIEGLQKTAKKATPKLRSKKENYGKNDD